MALIGILKNKAGKDFFPRTKMDAVDGLNERLGHIEVKDITETTEITMPNSCAGRLLFTEIKGVMEQGENPSPTNQQEIKNSVVSGIKTHGKNFFGFGKTAIDITDEIRGTSKQRVNISKINDNEIRCDYDAGSYCYGYIAINGVDGTKDWYIKYTVKENTTSYGISVKKASVSDSNRLVIQINGGNNSERVESGNYFVLTDIMISEEDIAYEPYTESVITFSQPIELYGLDDVQDILTSKQIKRKFVKRVLNGSEDWKTSSSLAGRYYVQLGGSKYAVTLCTQYVSVIGVSTTIGECYFSSTNVGRLCVNTEFATLDEWKAHLQANPMTVVYERATEITEELPIADQIALNGLETFYGITHVEFVSEIQPIFSAKYGTTEMGGMTLESLLTARSNDLRLSAVESAVINNI